MLLLFSLLRQVRSFVVGHVESTAFENESSTTGNKAPELSVAPWTSLEGRFTDALELFERVLTLDAFVFVGRHR